MFKSFRKSSSSSSSSSGSTVSKDAFQRLKHLVDDPSVLSKPGNFKVIAEFDFSPVNLETDLPMVRGEEYDVIDSTGVWWLARDKHSQIGLIPYNYVRGLNSDNKAMLLLPPKYSISHYPWYFTVDREKAELILKQCNRDGVFLVRPSSSRDCMTLSVLCKNKEHYKEVKHYLIQQCSSTGYYYITTQEMFANMEKLVRYYKQEKTHLVTKLSISPCRANLQFNQLPSSNNFSLLRSLTSLLTPGLTKTDKSWEIKATDLQLLEELGSGQFGVVRHGKWKSKIDVAVKLMKEGTMSEQDFIEEAKVMTQLQHPNLVKLYGLCIEHRPICIVAEFMKHGSLLSFLRKYESKLESREMLLNMCVQVCGGMAYLESKYYIHRDLAARNCLVNHVGTVKVADFGLTRYVIDDEYTSSGGTKFPIRWAPPEVLCFTRFSSKSDVWAYGILVWEVFSLGKLPYSKMNNTQVVDQISTGYRLEKPKNCPNEVYKLMKLCWEEQPENRPSFAKLEQLLARIKANWVPSNKSNGSNTEASSLHRTKQPPPLPGEHHRHHHLPRLRHSMAF